MNFRHDHFWAVENPYVIGERKYLPIYMWFIHVRIHHFLVFLFVSYRHPNRWIARAEQQNWSARFSYMYRLDFYLWGHLKILIYKTPVVDENDKKL